MKKGLILFTKKSIDDRRADPEALCQLLNGVADSKVEYSYAFYDDLIHIVVPDDAKIVDSKSGIDLADYDIVYHRRWGGAQEAAMSCSIYLSKKDIPFIDQEAYGVGSLNKLTQHWRFWENKLPHPRTLCFPRNHRFKEAAKMMEKYKVYFPVIAKSTEGTRGEDNFLISKAAELKKLLKDAKTSFLIQEYIPNDGDYRVIIGEGKVLLTIERKALAHKHLNNISQGGNAQVVDSRRLSRGVVRDIKKAAHIMQRSLSGVDIMFHSQTKQHYLLEVNRSPQIEDSSFETEKARAVSEYLQSKL